MRHREPNGPGTDDRRETVGSVVRSLRAAAVTGTAVAALMLSAAGPASAADSTLSIELNRIEDVEGGCRLSFVLTNAMPVSVDGLAIEAVLFDAQGRVERFLLLKAKPLPQGRTRVQQFDVGGASCAAIGRILLNDVTGCAGEGLSPAACLEAMRPTSRTDVPFSTALAPAPVPAEDRSGDPSGGQ